MAYLVAVFPNRSSYGEEERKVGTDEPEAEVQDQEEGETKSRQESHEDFWLVVVSCYSVYELIPVETGRVACLPRPHATAVIKGPCALLSLWWG